MNGKYEAVAKGKTLYVNHVLSEEAIPR